MAQGNEPVAMDGLRCCPVCGTDNRQRSRSKYSRDAWVLKDCAGCGLLYLENPPPVQALISEYNWTATSAVADEQRYRSSGITRGFRQGWKRWRKRLLPRRKLQRLLDVEVGSGNVLDVGCGSGGMLGRLPEVYVPFGIEIDSEAIADARQVTEARGGNVVHADALSGLRTFASESMHGIVMHSFLEHEVAPAEVLKESRRVLTKNGVLIIKVPNLATWNRRFWHGSKWPGFRYPDHVNYFTPATLERLIRQSGLGLKRFTWRDRLATSDNMWLVAARG